MRLFDSSRVALVLFDNDARYLELNLAARLMARRSPEDMLGQTVFDSEPATDRPRIDAIWKRLMDSGCATGTYWLRAPYGTNLEVAYFGLADVVPGRHAFAFAPAAHAAAPVEDGSRLTPREREVLQLAADGLAGAGIAERLVVSPATVKTHLTHIYEKLEARDRAAAVATALRLGLID